MAQESRFLHNLVSFLIIPAVLGFFFVPGYEAFAQELIAESEPAPVVEVIETIGAEVLDDSVAAPEEVVEASEEAVVEEIVTESEAEITEAPEIVAEVVVVDEVVTEADSETGLVEELPADVLVSLESESAPVQESVALLAISAEFGGTALVSTSESTFTTAPVAIGGLAISAEYSFTTSSGGGGCPSGCGGGLSISDEFSFTTLGGGLAISDEQSFTTSSDGGGCTSNCGGGGGGGGGRRPPRPEEPEIPILPCPLYLTEYIRLGRANNPLEVRKLQAFLNVFEGERLAITGVYSQVDFDAVSRFQRKYGGDVLAPWAIGDSTGYVFITTRLAINNIYCQRSTQHDLDLSRFYPEVYQLLLGGEETDESAPADEPVLPVDISEDEISDETSLTNRLQLAALAFLNIFKLSSGQALIALLALAALFVLFLLWRLNRYPDAAAPSDLIEDDFYPLPPDESPESEADEIIIEDDPASELEAGSDDPTQPPLDSIK